MSLTKPCEQCGCDFAKPPNCSAAAWPLRRFCSLECKIKSQVGKPSGKAGHKAATSRMQYLACRICGRPTRYHGTAANSLSRMVRCDRPECKEASRAMKNAAIREAHVTAYQNGTRARLRENWSGVPRVSAEEIIIAPTLLAQGWVQQFKVVPGIKGRDAPRTYHLDFALPDRKLCVEIDGSVHRTRRERDARKDEILAALGWKVLRIEASLVRECPGDVLDSIRSLGQK